MEEFVFISEGQPVRRQTKPASQITNMNEPTRQIELTQGQYSTVDACDFEYLNQFNWYASKRPTTHGIKYYAMRVAGPAHQQRAYYMHRVVAERAFPDFDASKEYDHRDCQRLNNTRQNLRPCTINQNGYNSVKMAGMTSRYKGVFWNTGKGKWTARICVNKKHIHIGHFDDEIEAAAWYAAYALFYHGEFANIEPAPL